MKKKIEVLETANEYLYNLEKGIEQVTEYIELDKEAKACKLIEDISEGLGWILEVIRLTEEVHKGQLSTTIIENNIGEIVEALENEDYTLVGDLFNYELLPEIEELHKGIKSLVI